MIGSTISNYESTVEPLISFKDSLHFNLTSNSFTEITAKNVVKITEKEARLNYNSITGNSFERIEGIENGAALSLSDATNLNIQRNKFHSISFQNLDIQEGAAIFISLASNSISIQ